MKDISKFSRYTTVFLALCVLASCTKTGNGIKDNFALRDVAAAPGTKVFVRNAFNSGLQLISVTLNDVKVAELGAFEMIAVDAPVDRSTLKIGFAGLSLSAKNNAVARKFSMKLNQKRFFIAKTQLVHPLVGHKLITIEITQDEFFRN